MVIGGGIAGIQASLDLAEAGVPVILVEKKPSIGGVMAALDKNFPTLDCSICIEAPKMSEVMQNKNITVRTLTEVIGVSGRAGNFKVKVREKARYVTDACTRCDECVKVCPEIRPNEFDHGLGFRKAIYTPFQQAEPSPYVIDIDACLNNPPNYMPCNRCLTACLPQAIDFMQEPYQEEEINVSAIILATGFDMLDASILQEYNYGKHPDILTSIEYERMLNSAGPTEGHIIRPSNHEHPEKIAFILCVGSRDQRYAFYCSRVCCMYSIKEAYQTIDHGVKDVTVLYMDIRAYGKGFDEFHARTKKEGVKYIRGRPSEIQVDGDKPVVIYEDTEKQILHKEEFDLVVLAPALLPSEKTMELAELMGIDIGIDGFIATRANRGNPIETTRKGIFVCGSASGPKDIPDSVAEASAAAAAAMTYAKQRYWPEEHFEETIDPYAEERVGVFICDCGSNIKGVVDVPKVVEIVKNDPGVVHSEEVMFACAGNTVKRIADTIKEKQLNRLVVAACSPKTHSPTFQYAAQVAGLNKYLIEMANIRNQNSWVHKSFPQEATIKAVDLVRMAVEKSKKLEPLKESDLPVTQTALVIGGGVAGMAAAWNLAKQGFETHLVEKEPELGGMLRRLHELAPLGVSAREVLDKMIKDVKEAGVKVYTNTTVKTIGGVVGNFHVTLSNDETLDIGAIVLAYGGTPYTPKGFDYGKRKNVITNLELEQSIDNRPEENITFVGCVGSRFDDKGCSRYCCASMIHQAVKLRDQGKNVTVLYKDIRMFSRHAEELYYEAGEKGVVFAQMPQDVNPEEHVKFEDGYVRFKEELIDEEIMIPTDLLVLAVGISPPADHDIADILKVSKTEDNFLLELHPKLAPLDAAVHGVYMAGNVRGPVLAEEAISQGLGAASRASDLLAKDTVTKEPLTAKIDPEICIGCQRCAKVCTYNAIEGAKKEAHRVIEAACMGCGSCAAVCPTGAITMPGFTDEQILVQIDQALAEEPEEKVLVFACNWCSYAGADLAGISKIQYPPSSRIIRTMCSARVSGKFVEYAFEKNVGAVLVTGCRLTEKGSDCHYNFANKHTLERFQKWKKKLTHRGIEPERLQLQWVSASEGIVLAKKLYEMEEVLKRLKQHKNGNGKKHEEKKTAQSSSKAVKKTEGS